eukprot:262821_1
MIMSQKRVRDPSDKQIGSPPHKKSRCSVSSDIDDHKEFIKYVDSIENSSINRTLQIPSTIKKEISEYCIGQLTYGPLSHPVLFSSTNDANNQNNNTNTNGNRHNEHGVYNFQNVDFQQIKANGAPYNCPFCHGLSFQVWADWKQHWYQLHNTKYFDDAKKNMKLNMNNHNNATYKPNNSTKKRNHTTMTNGLQNDKLA